VSHEIFRGLAQVGEGLKERAVRRKKHAGAGFIRAGLRHQPEFVHWSSAGVGAHFQLSSINDFTYGRSHYDPETAVRRMIAMRIEKPREHGLKHAAAQPHHHQPAHQRASCQSSGDDHDIADNRPGLEMGAGLAPQFNGILPQAFFDRRCTGSA
jgi:hypothetical protein